MLSGDALHRLDGIVDKFASATEALMQAVHGNAPLSLEAVQRRLKELGEELDHIRIAHAEMDQRISRIEDGLPAMANAIRELRKG